MTKEITVEMLDRTIAWCEQKLADAKASAIPRMQDFYFEKSRHTVDQDWPETFTLQELADTLGEDPIRYRTYYSQDNLTLRLFVFRPRCTYSEEQKMLALGFVPAKDGDSDTIPNQETTE